ncbi:MAG: hypothetical protein ACOYPR_20490, partial [Saprospiraceae bacterium]
IMESLKILNPGGIIIIHDCLPPDEWHQRPEAQYQEGENWNGTVWKQVLRTFNSSSYACCIVEIDWGCGIIDTANQRTLTEKLLPDNINYSQHFNWLSLYRIGIYEFIRNFVTVFYHLACMGNWREVFLEQMLQIVNAGYRNVRLTVLGSNNDRREAIGKCSKIGIYPEILFESEDLTLFECPALLAIEHYARTNSGFVLYLHSKGVSNPNDKTKSLWRQLMMCELVENWKYCIKQLSEYDIVGVNWREMPPISHYCGNFWYATTIYLRQLPDFATYYDNPCYLINDTVDQRRLGCEFWIGSATKSPRILSLAFHDVDFCDHNFWSLQYTHLTS